MTITKKVDKFQTIYPFDPVFNKLQPGKPVMICYETQLVHRQGITLEDIKLMKENFENKVLGVEIPFDENHKLEKAFGWAESIFMGEVELKNGEKHVALFANPKWNSAGQKSVDECEYIYTSPTIYREWTHPMTGQLFRSVLRSVSLLNDPQLINQPPVEMSAEAASAENTPKGEPVNMEKFKAFLISQGCSFGATDATSEDALVERTKTLFAAEQVKTKAEKDRADGLQKQADTFKADMEKYKLEADTFKAADKKARVEKVIAASKTVIAPAKADEFKALAEKDIDQAEKYIAMTGAKIDPPAPGHGEGDRETFSAKQDDREKETKKIAERMAAEQKKPVESCMRAAMQEYSEKLSAEKAKAAEGGK